MSAGSGLRGLEAAGICDLRDQGEGNEAKLFFKESFHVAEIIVRWSRTAAPWGLAASVLGSGWGKLNEDIIFRWLSAWTKKTLGVIGSNAATLCAPVTSTNEDVLPQKQVQVLNGHSGSHDTRRGSPTAAGGGRYENDAAVGTQPMQAKCCRLC